MKGIIMVCVRVTCVYVIYKSIFKKRALYFVLSVIINVDVLHVEKIILASHVGVKRVQEE